MRGDGVLDQDVSFSDAREDLSVERGAEHVYAGNDSDMDDDTGAGLGQPKVLLPSRAFVSNPTRSTLPAFR